MIKSDFPICKTEATISVRIKGKKKGEENFNVILDGT